MRKEQFAEFCALDFFMRFNSQLIYILLEIYMYLMYAGSVGEVASVNP